ncbi:MAG: LOG family protein [Chloroflexi bacterium]|nr:LOG family protein [Chloroflexota bacterium]
MPELKPDAVERLLNETRDVLTARGDSMRSVLYKELLINALKCRRDNLDVLDLKIINRAIVEFRHASRVFEPYENTRKVSIFGSARVLRDDPYYKMASDLGRLLASQGYMVITGAAEGIMEAGIEGAGPENSFGVGIVLPYERGPAKVFQDDPKLVTFKYFFTRKLFFVMEASAFALFPGGFGTQNEAFEVLVLVQTGKATPKPLLLIDLPDGHYWETWDRFVNQELLNHGYIYPEDRSFYRIVHSPEEVLEWVRYYYSTYHSMRQVGETLVIRLEKEMRDEDLRQLTESFPDIIASGGVLKTSALPQEKDEPDILSKPRIAFAYNKRSAGRLNQMVLEINRLGRSNEA